jgi:hypothetical protein
MAGSIDRFPRKSPLVLTTANCASIRKARPEIKGFWLRLGRVVLFDAKKPKLGHFPIYKGF